MKDSFDARASLRVGDRDYDYFRLDAVGASQARRLPFSLKILLENLLRHEDGENVTRDDITPLANVDMLPVVQSYACLTGEFDRDCWAETWTLA